MSKPVTICFIDDDKVYKYSVTRILKNYDLAREILVFSDGEEALSFLSDNAVADESLPDVIFLDINMPVMDGWQFLEEYVKLKPRINKSITIYLVTSSDNFEDREHAAAIGEIADYVVKPIMPQQLKALIQNIAKNTEH